MHTGVIDADARTFDLGVYGETDASLNINNTAVAFTFRKENGDLVKYQKLIANPTQGLRGDYIVSSPCKEVKEPFAVQGHYPLYLTAHTANQGFGTHVHPLNGKTYYMPNGVTIYHGDYTPADTYEELGGYMCVSK